MTRRKNLIITTAAPYASHNAAMSGANWPRPLTPIRAIGVLWVVAVPCPDDGTYRFLVWDAIRTENYRHIADELTRIGVLRKVRARSGDRSWASSYRLAPLDQPLDQQHSKTIKLITDYMLKNASCLTIQELCALGLLPKLMAGIRHRNSGARLEYAFQFLN
jgi:hypothetical protein